MPATDKFKQFSDPTADTLLASPSAAFSVTPSDSAELPWATRAIFVGTTGDLCLLLKDDATAVTFKNIPEGSLLPLRVKQVKATGTTAQHIVGLL